MIKTPLSDDPLPEVIFFDAMGTLFGLKKSVGEIYQEFAKNYGVETNASSLNNAFIESYQAAPSLAFTNPEPEEISQLEFIWWKDVVQDTFERVRILQKFSNFTDFFTELYGYFGTKEPWYIYPDVIPCLQCWQEQKIPLGVISNFDSRLINILKVLDLESFFTSITISSLVGYAKPESDIFDIALRKHNVLAKKAWHIGDSKKEDYLGAKNVGIHAFWLNRDSCLFDLKNQLPNLTSLG